MRRSIRTAAVAVSAVGLVFGLSACSEVEKKAVDAVDKTVNEEYEVTYEVTGKSVEAITFTGGGGTAASPKIETVDNPTLPWTKTVKLKGIMAPVVTPVAVDLTGAAEVTCKIVYKGKALDEKSGKGIGATGCNAMSPLAP
ncbi:MmpS family transport accessory protein [Streptomyces yaizuensis]|uniref:MmpS family transport accessory protein n=1 Tax=Streptomyces yaizuensis TaxID=2989713 RepID=A0ABQ5P5S5_9ACTN|nr:MmpS family transport accessory protein [Streptomyces sp. YSPA8]GLF97932.1 MmpS family transport accessory protein [Streptomyces sp. YSPA8]